MDRWTWGRIDGWDEWNMHMYIQTHTHIYIYIHTDYILYVSRIHNVVKVTARSGISHKTYKIYRASPIQKYYKHFTHTHTHNIQMLHQIHCTRLQVFLNVRNSLPE